MKNFFGGILKIFWGSQPAALRAHFCPKPTPKIDFRDFHVYGVVVWVQGAFGVVFGVAPSPDSDFLGQLGAPGAVAELQWRLSEPILGQFLAPNRPQNRFSRFSRPWGENLGPGGFREDFLSGHESRF